MRVVVELGHLQGSVSLGIAIGIGIILPSIPGSLIGCRQEAESTPAPPSMIEPAESWLVDVTAQLGIDFIYTSGVSDESHLPEIIGAGVGLFDYDNDGDLDICLTDGNDALPYVPRETTSHTGNRLFRQEPDGTFRDVTAESGIGDDGFGMGIAIGDVDNDGDLDVYFSNHGPDRLYVNNGDGTFTDRTEEAGLDVPGWSTSSTFLDYDRDGDLDLFVCQYLVYDPDMQCFDSLGRPTYCSPKAYSPVNDVLLRNDLEQGRIGFTDVTLEAGLVIAPAAGLGVTSEDFDDDGWLDLYVANDGYVNHLWTNRHDGTFEESAAMMGVAYNLNGQAEAGMGIVAMDVDDDLDLDLFITHLSDETNTLYVHDGNGYLDETTRHGLAIASLPFTGFGVSAIDLELDGDLDLAIGNGRVSRRKVAGDAPAAGPLHELSEPNQFYLNTGKGIFREVKDRLGTWSSLVELSRGLAKGDLDRDGDLDLVLSNIGSPARVFLNAAPRHGHWLQVRAIDPRLRRDAYHARITVEAGGNSWIQTINPGQSYLSSNEARAHFGLGRVSAVDRVTVRWPDGLVEDFAVDCVDCLVVLNRGEGSASP